MLDPIAEQQSLRSLAGASLVEVATATEPVGSPLSAANALGM